MASSWAKSTCLWQPSIWIARDADNMRLERRRAGGWSKVEIEVHQTSMRAVYQGLPGDGYLVRSDVRITPALTGWTLRGLPLLRARCDTC